MIIIPNGLTPQDIRILQEYRRMNTDSLPAEAIKAIRHPGGIPDASPLLAKGFLVADGDALVITQKGKDFLAIEATPEVKAPAEAPVAAASEPKAEGV